MTGKGILLVDDEKLALKYFEKTFGDRFPVYAANSAAEALDVLDSHGPDIGVIVTDQRMPEFTGVELLAAVRKRYPSTTRILTTAYSEWDTLVEAVNSGAIHSFVPKPWKVEDFEDILMRAFDFHREMERPKALEQHIDSLETKVLGDRTYDLGLIAAKMGHYIHNALCPLTLLLDELLERTEHQVFAAEFLQSVRSHIYDLATTLRDLEQIRLSGSSREYELLDVRKVFQEAMAETAIMRNQRGLRLEMAPSIESFAIRAVPAQIAKLCRFLIAEEVASLPPESTVHVRFARVEGNCRERGVSLEIEDSVPLPEKFSPQNLIEPFNLRGTNPRDFGVFLISCYFIVRHHGGTMTAKENTGDGLCLSIFLPRDPHLPVDEGAEPEEALLHSPSAR